MAIDYKYLLGLPPLVVSHRYTAKDSILYALGVGAGLAAIENPRWLRFVYEPGLQTLPTQATVLAYPGFWAKDPKYGITWQKLLHRDQSVELHRAIPSEGEVRGEMTIAEIYDRGADKGALLYFSRRIFSADGELLATVRQVNLLRADGGFGGPPERTMVRTVPPTRPPDARVRLATNRDQALLYRLSGDLNPLHVDPAAAAAAGFDRPILHGLSSFGAVGLAVLGTLPPAHPIVNRLDSRFANPVFPGETFEVSVWHQGPEESVFEARILERDVVVIRDGLIRYSA